jgi:hypothetical protein
VKRALDLEVTAVDDARIDRALQSEAESIDGGQGMRRFFYPIDATCYLDWPLRITSTRRRGSSASTSRAITTSG